MRRVYKARCPRENHSMLNRVYLGRTRGFGKRLVVCGALRCLVGVSAGSCGTSHSGPLIRGLDGCGLLTDTGDLRADDQHQDYPNRGVSTNRKTSFQSLVSFDPMSAQLNEQYKYRSLQELQL